MKIPVIVQKVVDASQIDSSLKFVEILGMVRKQPCLRLFAYKNTKTHKKQCKEVGRRFIDRDTLTGSLYYTRLGGYQVMFTQKKKLFSGYYILKADDHFYKVTDKSDMLYPQRYYNRLYTNKDVERYFKGCDERLKYLVVPELTEINDTMDFLRMYRDHPTLERLTKAGFAYLYNSKVMYRFTDQKYREFTIFLKINRDYILKNKPKFAFMLQAMKLKMSALEYESNLKAVELQTRFNHAGIEYSLDLCKEMWNYILKQESDIDTYSDYITACRIVGINTHDRGVLFPRNLVESHDNALVAEDEKENGCINEGLVKASEILKRFIENTGEFQLVLPKSKSELIKWGNVLHCCVGKADYGEKMSKGNTIIIGVFFNGQIIECCEIGKNFQNEIEIIQLRGDHNLDSPFHQQALSVTNQFLISYKPQNLMGSVI